MSKTRITAQKSVASSNTPSCKSGHFWSYDEDGNICVNIDNCITGEDLKIAAPESVVTGIKFPGDDEIYAPDENGCITLPADKFSTGELSEDGTTLTVIMDGLDMPVDICLDPVKGAVIIDDNGDVITEIPVVDGILQLPDLSQCWGYDDNGDIVTNIPNCISGELLVICGNPVKEVTQGDDGVTTVTYADESSEEIEPSYAEDNGDGTTTTYHPDGSEHTTCNDPVKTVNGVAPDADGNVDSGQSTTVNNGDGTHTITTDDNVSTVVCLMPVKTINGVAPDAAGNVNPADLFSTTVDNGDGTFTTTNPDNTSVTWSGDTFASQMDNGDGTVTFTMADASTVTLCLNPVKSVETQADGSTLVTYQNGVTAVVASLTSNDGTITITPTATGHDISGSSGSITDNGDLTATAVIGGQSCDLATVRVENPDDCFTEITDTKTGAVVTRLQREQCESGQALFTQANPRWTPTELAANNGAGLVSVNFLELCVTNNSCRRMVGTVNFRGGNPDFIQWAGDNFAVTADFSCGGQAPAVCNTNSGTGLMQICFGASIQDSGLFFIDPGQTTCCTSEIFYQVRAYTAASSVQRIDAFGSNIKMFWSLK